MGAMRAELEVEPETGPTYVVVADQRDVSRYELEDFYTHRKHTTLRYLAWAASVRLGQTALSWGEFNAQVVEVDEVSKPKVDAVDPGQPDPKTASS
jgi:hypothetical protein